jgi:hypothetical protein
MLVPMLAGPGRRCSACVRTFRGGALMRQRQSLGDRIGENVHGGTSTQVTAGARCVDRPDRRHPVVGCRRCKRRESTRPTTRRLPLTISCRSLNGKCLTPHRLRCAKPRWSTPTHRWALITDFYASLGPDTAHTARDLLTSVVVRTPGSNDPERGDRHMRRDEEEAAGDSREQTQERGSLPRTPIPEREIRVLVALGQLATLVTVLIQRGWS